MSIENGVYVFSWVGGAFVPAGVLYMIEEGNPASPLRT
jgi:serine/threonine-protein kinase HipA